MAMFSTRRSESAEPVSPATPEPLPSNGASASARSGGLLSRGVSITGSVNCHDQVLIDGEVKGDIKSAGTRTIGEHASINGEVRSKSVTVQGTVEGNIFATERCELLAGCTLHGDVEAPRLVVDENATFLGSAKIGSPK